MSRCTITFEDSLEVDIKRYMQKKNIKLKSKAIREIVKNYFQSKDLNEKAITFLISCFGSGVFVFPFRLCY